MFGTLYIVATPIGNLGDLTHRASETLSTCDVVACEDTRRTDALLRYLNLRKPLQRYDEHTHLPASRKLLEHLKAGKSVALVTDAGTPGLSDPGSRLITAAIELGVKVVPIPGVSAITTALSASGLGSEGFVFLGFLPRRPGRGRRLLREAMGLGKTVVVFESPFRVAATLDLLVSIQPNAHVVVARELTKIHEEFLRGSVSEVQALWKERPLKGEVVLILRGIVGDDDDSERSDGNSHASSSDVIGQEPVF